MKQLNVAIIGQGRSGMDIHGNYFKSESNKYFNVVAVVDELEIRRKRTAGIWDCDIYSHYSELFNRNDIDLVVNATFSHHHYPVTIDLLEHKLNVLVEKPFSRYKKDCAHMIETAEKNGVMLAVFQQSRLAPYYKRIKEILASGKLGEIIQISIAFSGFARRWDWQCVQRFCAGSLLNTGPHPMDQALDLLGFDDNIKVFSKLARVNTSGDAEDYVKVILTAPGKPLVDIEISSCDAYSGFTYKIQGSRGGLKATHNEIEWKYFIAEDEPVRELILEPLMDENGAPLYCSETLKWHENREVIEGGVFTNATAEFYENIYYHLTEGRELVVSPWQVMKQIEIAEEIHNQNPLDMIY